MIAPPVNVKKGNRAALSASVASPTLRAVNF
jgi:hypothetical protein